MVVRGRGIKLIELDFRGVGEIMVTPEEVIIREQVSGREVHLDVTGYSRLYIFKILMPIIKQYWTACDVEVRQLDGDNVVEIIAGSLTIKLFKMVDHINRMVGVLELNYEDVSTISSAYVETHWIIGECFKEEVDFKKYPHGNGERKVVSVMPRDKICLIFSYRYSYRENVPRDITSERVELTILERPW